MLCRRKIFAAILAGVLGLGMVFLPKAEAAKAEIAVQVEEPAKPIKPVPAERPSEPAKAAKPYEPTAPIKAEKLAGSSAGEKSNEAKKPSATEKASEARETSATDKAKEVTEPPIAGTAREPESPEPAEKPAEAPIAEKNGKPATEEAAGAGKAGEASRLPIEDRVEEIAKLPIPDRLKEMPRPPKPRTITISVAGDCTLGEYKGQGGELVRDYYDMEGADWFFAGVKSIFSTDDYTFVNLEGPLTDLPLVAVKKFPIRGDPRNVNALRCGSVEVCNLCNNHIQDCGDAGMAATEELLAANRIAYCGGTENGTLLEKNGLKTAFLGYDGWGMGAYIEDMIASDIAEMRAQGANLVVCEFHWGEESEYLHNPVQEALAHHAIDCGADLVVGGHAHVLQDTEVYEGKLIVYGLGNFVFGANSDPDDKDTVIVRLTFVETKNGMEYGETRFIPCRLSSAEYGNNYQPVPYTGAEDIARVLDKLRAG